MKYAILFLSILLYTAGNAQDHSHMGAQPLTYPNIPGYTTLKTDFHQHTVFSDGNVWPTIRVQEALRENLDAIALTEHLEYQPHAKDIPHPDRNRSFELAKAMDEAEEHGLLVVHGSEITRSEPVGHSNALFISDANQLLHEKPEDAFAAAKEQAAFVFWNHPAWHRQSPKGTPILSDFQKARIKNDELHGIEVINNVEYSEEALKLALEQDLTIMGTSDIHGLIDWNYTEKGNHRPITLVFAREKSIESLREALFAGRTIAVFNDLMVGREEFLAPLLQASIEIIKAEYIENTQIVEIELQNISSSDLLFENAMDYTFYDSSPVFEIPAGKSKILQIKTLEKKDTVTLKLKALGCFTAPQQQPVIEWGVQAK
ncbi:Sb-PDE family phosphodiesterase [Pricia sp. S334]|uniref:Sb-PDE family phosphodiesterase n=1 Tax=Pricia mediterranea TaxID=3076079 RepID=A0ABU3L3H3_9FLAO|nr:Sb-PDE family phosphodiesterase [Pricia sp. S334]MDT7827754.1 Sb-PDE family phosphodiesterase [Pricia sp. S334]